MDIIRIKNSGIEKKKNFSLKKLLGHFPFYLFLYLWTFLPIDSKASPKIRIMTSVFPLKEFAQSVSGNRGEVSLILPAGAEIHTWQPLPSDIIKLSHADLFIYIGAELEPWLHDILKSARNPRLRVMEVSQGLSLIEKESDSLNQDHKHKGVDPHVWLDFENDQIIIDKIEALLSEIDPEGSAIYQTNAESYKQKLRSLDENFSKGLKNCSLRTFVLGGHAAFGYLARRYRLRQICLYGLSPDSMPTPKHLIEVIELAKKDNIRVVFFETYVSDKLAKIIAKEVGAVTLILNPGANLSREKMRLGTTFFDIMNDNLENLRYGLSCR